MAGLVKVLRRCLKEADTRLQTFTAASLQYEKNAELQASHPRNIISLSTCAALLRSTLRMHFDDGAITFLTGGGCQADVRVCEAAA